MKATYRKAVNCNGTAFSTKTLLSNWLLATAMTTCAISSTSPALALEYLTIKSARQSAVTRPAVARPAVDKLSQKIIPDGASLAGTDNLPIDSPAIIKGEVLEQVTIAKKSPDTTGDAADNNASNDNAIKEPELSAQKQVDKVELAKYLDNFDMVNPQIWRGGAPNKTGVAKLAASGVKTIIDLRMTGVGTLTEEVQAKALGISYVHIPMTFACPPIDTVAQFMHVATNPLNQPVYVHCRQGADRTGTLIGIMRVTQDKWSYRQAYSEMRQHHFKPWFNNLSKMVANYENNRQSQRQLAQATQAYQ